MHIIDLGLIDYRTAYYEQRRLHARVVAGSLKAALILCRHNPVITVGRSAKPGSLLLQREEYARLGIDVVDADRGGDVTYHGPGQIIAYPVFPMNAFGNDLHAYLRFLEGSAITALGTAGIQAARRNGLTGAWIGKRKIASIGIAVRSRVSYHGISLNIQRNDLAGFSLIRPCGLDIAMTSVETELNRAVLFYDITHSLIRSLSNDQCCSAAAG